MGVRQRFSKEEITMFTDPVHPDGTKAEGIIAPEPYKIGEEPKTVAGLPTVGEYVYVEPVMEEETKSEAESANAEVFEITPADKPFIAVTSAVVVLSAVVVSRVRIYKEERSKSKCVRIL